AVVVGIDGSEGSLRALAWACAHAESAHSNEVRCVLAYESPLAWVDVGADYEDAMLQGARERASATLDEALQDVVAPTGVILERCVQQGIAADVLVDASRGADLLVVGSRGRGGFAGLLLGSVSQRCVERAWCPVVVVPARTAGESAR